MIAEKHDETSESKGTEPSGFCLITRSSRNVSWQERERTVIDEHLNQT